MKSTFIFGLGIAVAGAVLNYVFFFLGYHADPGSYRSAAWLMTPLGLAIAVVGLWLGIRAVRENAPDRSLSYGRGVAAGALIGVSSGIFTAIFTFIYGTVVNPAFHEMLYQISMQAAEQKGVPADRVAQAEGVMRMFTSPAFIALSALLSTPITYTILALILSAFLKRPPAPAEPPPMPAAG